MKSIKIITLILISCTIIFSCSEKNNFNKDKTGLEYIIIESEDSNSDRVNLNDVLIMDMSYELENGNLLFNSSDHERRYLRKIVAPTHSGGSFEDGLLMLKLGDSAIFRINATNFLMYSESYKRMPEGINLDDNLLIKVKIKGKVKREDHEDLLIEKYHSSEEVEMELLETFISNANINTEPKESGLYYVELTKGKGKKAKVGDIVSVFYTLTLLDGRFIETNLNDYPFNFKLGNADVIKGWDEGISYMNEGGKAKLIIPSKLAYGNEGSEDILPYTTLVFDVELVSVK